MGRKLVAAFLAAALLAAELFLIQADALTASAQAIPDTRDFTTKAKGAVVMDALTGRVLFAQNANLKLPMASTTKIMSALLTLEQEDTDLWFTVDSDAIRVEGSSMGLREGDSVTLDALAYGMLLPSGNDGANAAAVRIAGSKERFAALMNARAQEIGMTDTHFVTPSGLDAPEHYSTAYDMALLAREALENPRFADICSRSKAVVQYGNPPYNRWMKNHNRLLRECEGAIGVKTGFTDSAGRCLVSAAMRGGMRLIVVTLGCPDDWNTHSRLYDRYFGLLTPTDVSGELPAVSVPVAGGQALAVQAENDPVPLIPLLQGETVTAVAAAKPLLFAPVAVGQLLGTVKLYGGGELLYEYPLTAAQTVAATEDENSLIDFFKRMIGF